MGSGTARDPWLVGLDERSHALLLEGPAGIGKTHLFNALVADAGAAGWRLLRAQPAESELRLIGSSLIDLCDGVTDAELDQLPRVQAEALAAAVLRGGPPADGPLTPHAVMVAFTTLLRRLAEADRLLICVDDVQWLDPQTAEVLAFAARRLPTSRIGMLLALRSEPGVAAPELIADLTASMPLTRRVVAPMDRPALERVVIERLGRAVPSSVLRTALDSASGNPLFGIEVARTLLTEDRAPDFDQVPLPASLSELVGRHVSDLPKPTRLALAATAALRRPTMGMLRELGLAEELPEAELAGLIRIDSPDIAFTHPLYAAAAYDSLAGSERGELHARLATVVTGQEELARHLALGADEADESVAAALDVARDQALARGATLAAIDACRLAVRATPAGSPRLVERQIQFGRMLFRAGETANAKRELSAAVELATDAAAKARALHELGRVVTDTESELQGAALQQQALALAGDDLDLLADIHMGLAVSHIDDWQLAVVHARTACELLDSQPDADPRKVAAALTSLAAVSFYAGLGADFDACRRAVELESGSVAMPVSDRALSVLFYLQLWTDDFPAAREQMRLAYALAVDEGDEASRAYILSIQAQLEMRAGNWDRADRLVEQYVELNSRSQNTYYIRIARQLQAWLAAYRGDLAPAVAEAEEDVRAGEASANPLVELRGRGLLGFCALVRGDAKAAIEQLDRYNSLFELNHAGEPALRQLAGDHIEALVACGRLEDAEAALAELIEPAARLGRTAVLAGAARAEALLYSARGDGDAAVAAAERSVQLYDEVERRFDRARAVLTKGQVHRRFKQKSLARQELSAALAAFEGLGAAGFAERTREELSRIGLRPAATQELTETERQIAELTAKGMTSAEVAGALFLSTKTVSANLTRIYRKLGVRNRGELTAHLANT